MPVTGCAAAGCNFSPAPSRPSARTSEICGATGTSRNPQASRLGPLHSADNKLLGVRLDCTLRRQLEVSSRGSHLVSAIVSPGKDAGLADEQASPSWSAEELREGKFDWNSQWYPVFVAAHLDKRLPHPATVLGRDFVVWWDPNGGSWQIFEDRCPHRLAPLSEGRIGEDGHLHCSYHGWAFAPSTGACSLIPQAPPDRLTAKNSKRACATVYLSTVHQGLLWLWPDSSEGAQERAEATSPPLVPELSDPNFVFEYGYETLTENLLDPSHVPFAHHRIQGNRNIRQLFEFVMQGGISKSGFVGELPQGPLRWQSPCLITQSPNLPIPQPGPSRLGELKKLLFGESATAETQVIKPRRLKIVLYCVPVAPGRSRVFAAFPRNFAKIFHYLTPTWIEHQTRMLVFISDLYLLHVMERKIEQLGGNRGWSKAAYVPTKADRCAVPFRVWLERFSGGTVDWGGADGSLPPTPSRRELLDRYSMHVEKCPSCSGALAAFKVAETGLLGLSFALVALLAASGASPELSGVRSFAVFLAVTAVASFALSKVLTWYIHRAFYFSDYIHGLVK